VISASFALDCIPATRFDLSDAEGLGFDFLADFRAIKENEK